MGSGCSSNSDQNVRPPQIVPPRREGNSIRRSQEGYNNNEENNMSKETTNTVDNSRNQRQQAYTQSRNSQRSNKAQYVKQQGMPPRVVQDKQYSEGKERRVKGVGMANDNVQRKESYRDIPVARQSSYKKVYKKQTGDKPVYQKSGSNNVNGKQAQPHQQKYQVDQEVEEEDEEEEEEEEDEEGEEGEEEEEEGEENEEEEEEDVEEEDDEDEYEDEEEGEEDEEDEDEYEYEDEEEEEEEEIYSEWSNPHQKQTEVQESPFPQTVLGDILNPNKVMINPFRKGKPKSKAPLSKKASQVEKVNNDQKNTGTNTETEIAATQQKKPKGVAAIKKPLRPKPKQTQEYFECVGDNRKPKKKDQAGLIFGNKLTEYAITKVIFVAQHVITYELNDKEGKPLNLLFFDQGLTKKDLSIITALYPNNLVGTPKIHLKGESELPGHEKSYWAIVEPLPLSLAEFIAYHSEKKMIFKEEELLFFFTDAVKTLINISPILDLYFITDYDLYLDQTYTHFLVAPFTLDKRFAEITTKYTYDQVRDQKVNFDPQMDALVEGLAPELIKAWASKQKFDLFNNREVLIIYSLGITLLKMASVRFRIPLTDRDSIDKLILDLRFQYKVVPALLDMMLAINPGSRKSLKYLLDYIPIQNCEVPPHITFKLKVNKIKSNFWEVHKINHRGEGDDRLDYIVNDMVIGKAYICAFQNYDQGVQFFDLSYENLASVKVTDESTKHRYIETLYYLSISMRKTEQLEEALEYIKEAALLYSYIYPRVHMMTARIFCERGSVYKAIDNTVESVSSFNEALDIYSQMGNVGLEYSVHVIKLRNEVRMYTKDHEKGRKELRELIDSGKYKERQLGQIYYQLAKLLESGQLFEDAVSSLQKSLYYYEASFEAKDEEFFQMLRDFVKLAIILQLYEKVEMIRNHYTEDFEGFIVGVKEEVIDILEQHGAAYKVHEKYEKAIEMFKRVSELKKEIYGKKDPDYLNSLEMIANMFEYFGDYLGALRQYEEIKAFKEAIYGEGSIRVTNTLISMGRCYEYLNQDREALKRYKEASEIQLVRLGEVHEERVKLLEKMEALRVKIKKNKQPSPTLPPINKEETAQNNDLQDVNNIENNNGNEYEENNEEVVEGEDENGDGEEYEENEGEEEEEEYEEEDNGEEEEEYDENEQDGENEENEQNRQQDEYEDYPHQKPYEKRL